MRHPVPHRSLRAFVATARLGSQTAAAAELNVTPGAVSRQIAALESRIGCALFARRAGRVALNERGERLLARVMSALDEIDDAILEATSNGSGGVVTIIGFPSVTLEWLVPRLPEFQASHPDIELRIRTALRPQDAQDPEIDIAFALHPSSEIGWLDGFFMRRVFMPVCHPSLIAGRRPEAVIAERPSTRILWSDKRLGFWQAWLDAADLEHIDVRHGIRYENSSMAFQSAREGAGFALGQPALVRKDLDAGTLVAPFRTVIDGGDAYFVERRSNGNTAAAVDQFLEWLARAVAAERMDAEQGGSPIAHQLLRCFSQDLIRSTLWS